MEVSFDVDIQLDEDQQLAVERGADLTQRLVAVSGPAGSGKTTLIRLIFEQLTEAGITCVLAAPTGKAARRIKEATGIDAVTIHKLLEYNRPGERDEKTGKPLDITKPKRDRMNPLYQKVVIVDEYAMVGHELHDNLMAALPSGGCLRAFGDINQLPPIEEYKVTDRNGRVEQTPFQKLIKRPESVVLNKVYRQGEGSSILLNADNIRKGRYPSVNEDFGEFYVKMSDNPVQVMKKLVAEAMDNGIDFRQIQNQIIVPMNKSWVGTMKLNEVLRAMLNPYPAQTASLERHKWFQENGVTCEVGIGDKVVCTSNTYDMRDYFDRFSEWTPEMIPIMTSYIPCPPTKQMLNGETGIILAIHPDGSMEIDFGDRIVEVPLQYQEYWDKRDTIIDTSPMRDIDLAYALTTHKCQGSEFQNVIYILNKSTQFAQSRQNFYTAVTRARKRVIVIADQYSLRVSVNKDLMPR